MIIIYFLYLLNYFQIHDSRIFSLYLSIISINILYLQDKAPYGYVKLIIIQTLFKINIIHIIYLSIVNFFEFNILNQYFDQYYFNFFLQIGWKINSNLNGQKIILNKILLNRRIFNKHIKLSLQIMNNMKQQTNNQRNNKESDKQNHKIEINQIRIPNIQNLFYIPTSSLIFGVLNDKWQSWNLVNGKLILKQDLQNQLGIIDSKKHFCLLLEDKQKIIVCNFTQNMLTQYSTNSFEKLQQIQLCNGVANESQIHQIPENNQIFIISQYNHKLQYHQCSINNINQFKTTLYFIQNQIWSQPIIDKRFIIIRQRDYSYIIQKQNTKIIRKINYRIESFNQRLIVTIQNSSIVVRDFASIKQKQEIKSMRKYQLITAQIVNSQLIVLYVKFIEFYNIQNFELTYYSTVPQCVSKMAKFYYFSSYNNQLFIFIKHNFVEVDEMGKQVMYFL
ncbi:hypothetical protein pb186bvf_009517 [Paramecium bursaria]